MCVIVHFAEALHDAHDNFFIEHGGNCFRAGEKFGLRYFEGLLQIGFFSLYNVFPVHVKNTDFAVGVGDVGDNSHYGSNIIDFPESIHYN